MTAPFHVLHVCTGNIGRSPMAERIMRMRLERAVGAYTATTRYLVDSAGTWGHTGSAMEPFAGTALASLGVNAEGFAARELTEEQVRSADLVLTATADHRSTVVGLVPAALHRTFTLREFARLSPMIDRVLPPGLDPVERSRRAVAEAIVARGRQPRAANPADDDVADPIGAPVDYYLGRAGEIDQACTQAVAVLTGVRR